MEHSVDAAEEFEEEMPPFDVIRPNERVGLRAVSAPPPMDDELADAPPPGWELDRLGDALVEEPAVQQDADHAMMAASFGLAPPPTPPGVQQETIGHSFEDALQRARERDEELRAELGEEHTHTEKD